ncbi:unnamed protein product, partial [Polarella glacialis]
LPLSIFLTIICGGQGFTPNIALGVSALLRPEGLARRWRQKFRSNSNINNKNNSSNNNNKNNYNNNKNNNYNNNDNNNNYNYNNNDNNYNNNHNNDNNNNESNNSNSNNNSCHGEHLSESECMSGMQELGVSENRARSTWSSGNVVGPEGLVRTKVSAVLKNWITTYSGNFVGLMIISLLANLAQLPAVPAVVELAQQK